MSKTEREKIEAALSQGEQDLEKTIDAIQELLTEARIEELTRAANYERAFIRNSKSASVMPLTRLQNRLKELRREE